MILRPLKDEGKRLNCWELILKTSANSDALWRIILLFKLIAFHRNHPRVVQTVMCKAIQMIGFSSLLIKFGNLTHRISMEVGNLLTDFNQAIELFKYRLNVSSPFQLDQTVPKVLLKAYHLAPGFSVKDIILVLYYFMSVCVGTFYL